MQRHLIKCFGLFLLLNLGSMFLNRNLLSYQPQAVQRNGSPHAVPLSDANKVKIIQSAPSINCSSSQFFRIFYWTKYTSSKSTNNWFGLGTSPFEKCEYKNCLTTNDLADYNSSDAVLFYIFRARSLPSYKFSWQKWILRTDESPANSKTFAPYNGLFNATWTYHSKSDIFSHMYAAKSSPIPESQAKSPAKTMVLQRKRGIAWLVGHCYTNGARHLLVKALQKYIPVDVYGRCGQLRCGPETLDCERLFQAKYRFYLAFENSLCAEYATEKLWRALHHNLVPIVMGGSNYTSYLPPHWFIDVANFSTVRALADYLQLLDTNDSLYLQYFEWKKHFKITYYLPEPCVLCQYLSEHRNETKVYDRMDLFWDKRTDCHPPQQYYKELFQDIHHELKDTFSVSFVI